MTDLAAVKVVAEVTSQAGWAGLIAALRSRVNQLDVTHESVSETAGLPARYSSKLLAPIPLKGLGRVSFGPLLGALGLKLLLVVDEEQMARVGDRLVRRKAGCPYSVNPRQAGPAEQGEKTGSRP